MHLNIFPHIFRVLNTVSFNDCSDTASYLVAFTATTSVSILP